MDRKDIKMIHSPVPAVITPLDEHMGLDIARSLYKYDIHVYGLDHDKSAVGKYSNACHFVLSPDTQNDPESYLEFLVEFAKRLNCKPVLYPLSDEHVLIISRNREALQENFVFVMPPKETIEALCTKVGLINVARNLNIPAPVTFFPKSESDFEELAQEVSYPVIVKPGESPHWHTPEIEHYLRRGILDGRAKVILCHNANELKMVYRWLTTLNPDLIVQEVIPGEDNRLYYVSFYMDRQSRPLAVFAGRKDRIIPIGFGSASFVHSIHDPKLVDAGLRVFTNTRYQGLGGIEFKKDPRDEKYKLIEVNTRFGLWDGLGEKCGVDTAYIAYCDALGLPLKPITSYRPGVIWWDWQRDLRAAVAYRRKGSLTWRSWLTSLLGEKKWAVYSLRDSLPGIFYTIRLIRILVTRLFSSLIRGNNRADFIS